MSNKIPPEAQGAVSRREVASIKGTTTKGEVVLSPPLIVRRGTLINEISGLGVSMSVAVLMALETPLRVRMGVMPPGRSLKRGTKGAGQ